jgi:hypothetical protein
MSGQGPVHPKGYLSGVGKAVGFLCHVLWSSREQGHVAFVPSSGSP